MTRRERIFPIFGGSIGNLVEWYDWNIYAAFALYFAPSFFPASDRTAQLLGAAAIFAVGFLMRPIGAWAMGIYSDRHGRKAGLTLSVLVMCAGSFAIAAVPTYASIGMAAPIILILARLLQGLSVGGEYGAGATYMSEMALDKNRGFWTSFHHVTLNLGQLSALGVLLLLQATLSETQLESWGWRIPFVVGGLLGLVALILRRRLMETEAFTRQTNRQDSKTASSLRALLRDHGRNFWLVFFLTAGGTLAFYAYGTYMQKFLVNTSGFSRQQATSIMTLALFCFMCVQPLYGALSDRIGRKPVMIGFGVMGTLCTVPIFRTLETVQSPYVAFALIFALLLIVCGYTSVNALVKAELFPSRIRALGVALPYALANALFGGSVEYVALQLKSWGHEGAFYWYITAMIAVSLVAYVVMPESKRASLVDEV